MVVSKDEGMGEHPGNPKNKVGEVSDDQPSHTTISQKIVDVQMDVNSSLVASSQKNVTIETSPHLGTQPKKGRDTQSPIKSCERRVKLKPLHKSHTSQDKVTDLLSVTSPIQIDLLDTPPPISILITFEFDFSQTLSPTSSIDVDLIHTTIAVSPSLTIMKEPQFEVDHHLFDNLLDQFLISSSMILSYVAHYLKSIATDSIVIASTTIPFISSTDIAHPLISVSLSTDTPNNIYLLISAIQPSTDDSHPLTIVNTSSNTKNPIYSTGIDTIIADTYY